MGEDMEQLLDILKQSVLFKGLTEDVLRDEIVPHGHLRDLYKKEVWLGFGDLCHEFGIVLKGRIRIQHRIQKDSSSIMDILEEGDLLGVDLVCTHSRISPYCAAVTQNSQVFLMPFDLLLSPGRLSDSTRLQLLQNMLYYLADQNIRKEHRLSILFHRGLRDRIMTFMMMQKRKFHSDTFTIPFNRDEMASYLCATRSCLSHELSLMAQEGIISFERNTFTLLHTGQTESIDTAVPQDLSEVHENVLCNQPCDG